MRSGNIIRLTRTESINERRKRLEAVPGWRFPAGEAVALAVVLVISSFLITAYTQHPYQEAAVEVIELPPIRDVSMDPPALWTYDGKAFIDPPGDRPWANCHNPIKA